MSLNRSRIEWCDYTFNPVVGCRHDCKTPDGKSYCYAKRMCTRFARPWGLDPADPFKPTFHPERLNEPHDVAKPSRIFVCSMADLFGEWVQEAWIEKIIMRADLIPRHTFIFLTKNPHRYREFDFPPNCWLGVTVTGVSDTSEGARGCDFIDGTKGKKNIRFVSWEPILGPLWRTNFTNNMSWLILGAMSGPGTKKYAPDPRWITDAVEQCRERDIPVFMKSSIAPYWKGDLVQEGTE